MRQTYDYEDQSGGLPLIYMALAVSAFVLGILVLVVTMNQDKKPSPQYTAAMQEESTEESSEDLETGHEIGGDLVASDLDFWDMYPIETETETQEEEESTEEETTTEEDPSKDGKHVEIVYRDGSSEWLAINPYWKKNTYDFANLVSKNDLLHYYSDGKQVSYLGVDLSKYQKSVDFAAIQSEGIDFCMLRVGSRGYETGTIQEDEKFQEFLAGAEAVGMPVGLYFFSQAVTEAEAIEEANFVISNIDSRNWTGITGGNDFCLYGYYENYWYDKNCNLYYNVEQKKTFEQAILDKLGSMDNSTERIEYYNLLVGNEELSMHGNHQIYNNIFEGESLSTYINNGNILNWFGYDMQGWNIQHCNIATSNGGDGLHKGIDISYPGGAAIYSPLDCKIDEYDAGGHVVILRQNNVNYWYGGKRDTKIYITNITLNSGYSEGSEIKA